MSNLAATPNRGWHASAEGGSECVGDSRGISGRCGALDRHLTSSCTNSASFPPLGERMPDRLFVWATIYRTIYAIIGSYITARLAPSRPMWHAMLGAIIGMIIGTVGAVVTWNKNLGPHWYPLALHRYQYPCAWIGAKIREMQLPE